MKTLYWKGYAKVGDHFYYLFTTVFHCLLNLFSFLLSNNYIFHVFLNMGELKHE